MDDGGLIRFHGVICQNDGQNVKTREATSLEWKVVEFIYKKYIYYEILKNAYIDDVVWQFDANRVDNGREMVFMEKICSHDYGLSSGLHEVDEIRGHESSLSSLYRYFDDPAVVKIRNISEENAAKHNKFVKHNKIIYIYGKYINLRCR